MQVCILAESSRGMTYPELAAVAWHAEHCGFTGLFLTDHFMPPAGGGHATDAWTLLAGLARDSSRIRLGTLVSSATFRLPGPLAITVAEVDRMSGGRVELGLGAGWFKPEHTAYGIPMRAGPERLARLAEQLEIVTGLWSTPAEGRYRYCGSYYRLVDAPGVAPHWRPPPVIVGGRGHRRTPWLAARYADEYNAPFLTVAEAGAQYQRVATAAAALARPTPRFSVALTVAVGATMAEARSRAEPLHQHGQLPAERPVVGTPAQLRDVVGAYQAIGVQRLYLRLPNPTDLGHLDLLAQTLLAAAVVA